jgi:hypothetical protein
MNLKNIFEDPSFRVSTNSCYPNRLYGNSKKGIGAVVVMQGRRGRDFPLSVAGLQSVLKAEASGRLKEGYVVLATQADNGSLQFLASARASEVEKRLHDIEPQDGNFGRYWWITESFMPAATSAAGEPW